MEKKFKLGPLKKRGKKEKASGEKPSIKLARFIIEKQNWRRLCLSPRILDRSMP